MYLTIEILPLNIVIISLEHITIIIPKYRFGSRTCFAVQDNFDGRTETMSFL